MGSDLRQLDAEVAECLGLHQRMIRPQPLTQFSGDKTYTPRYAEPHSLYGVPNDIQDGMVPYVELVQYELKPYSSCPLACEAVKAEIRKRVEKDGWYFRHEYVRMKHRGGEEYIASYVFIDTKHPDDIDGCHSTECVTEYEAVSRAFVAAVKGGQHVESR